MWHNKNNQGGGSIEQCLIHHRKMNIKDNKIRELHIK